MKDREVTAKHEAAHAVVAHVLGVKTERVFLDAENPRNGRCESEPVFQAACGDNNLRHPVEQPERHAWCVLVARRHVVAALAGIEMEQRLAHSAAHVPIAEDSDADRENAHRDLQFATKFVEMVGKPHFTAPDLNAELTKLKSTASAILSWPASQVAVENLAHALEVSGEIRDPAAIQALIEGSGLRFGCGFSAFAGGLTFPRYGDRPQSRIAAALNTLRNLKWVRGVLEYANRRRDPR